MRADVWTVAQTDQGNVVLVRPKQSGLVVPIFIGQLETQSILIGLGKVEMPRPLTHDLVLAMLRTLGADLVRVEIRDLKERTFYANVVVKSERGELTLDARPSDALALAIRSGAEVYVAEDVVETAGVPVDMIREAPPADEAASDTEYSGPVPGLERGAALESKAGGERDRLRAELEKAIEAEDYERAAAIRDRLKSIP